jgi:hypothetical protein
MKGSGRFGKYGDLKRKQRIRQNLQTPPVGGVQKAASVLLGDQRKKPRVSSRKRGDQESIAPGAGPELPENQ